MSIKALLTAAAASSLILGAGAASAQSTARESQNGIDRPGVSNSAGPLPGTATTSTSSETWEFNRAGDSRTNYDSTLSSQGDASNQSSAQSSSTTSSDLAQTPSSGNVAFGSSAGSDVTTEVIASAPVPDTPQNRARFGQPLSHTGRMTAPRGN